MRPLFFLFALHSLLSAEPISNSIGMRLVPVSPGSFTMGQDGPASDYNVKKHAAKFDDADWDERPAHRVVITQAFQISATEVTVGQYRQFDPTHRGQNDDDAVTEVSWNDAVAFCEWLSKKDGKAYRLPTEAEWEFACRAGTTTLFHTGEALPAGFHSWPSDTGVRDRFFPEEKMPPEYQPKPTKLSLKVGRTSANAWGLHDMHGNVAEWCADWYGPYEAAEQTDPLGRVDGDFRVIRGGSHSVQTRLLRSANRTSWVPQAVNERIGFRVVLGDWPKGEKLPLPKPALHAQNVSQSLAKIELPPQDVPYFDGPKPFVKVEPNSFGPAFSWHNHSPAIAECPNGDLLAVWYSCVDEAGTELNNLASRLRRGESEWEPASLFWDGADVNDHAPKLWWDGRKTLSHLVRGHRENIVRHSTDNGVTWSKAQIIQPWSEIGNQLLRTRDGTLLMTQDVTTTSLTKSTDGGKTWTSDVIASKKLAHRNGSAARHAGIHAPIVELNDGRLMSFGRLNSESEQKPYNFKTPASFSSDGGKTWTHQATEFPAISSVQRQALIRLREGPLLFCSFTDLSANARKPNGMTFQSQKGEFNGAGLFAAISFDDGKTWPHKRLVTPGGKERTVNGIDRNMFPLSDTRAEHNGYLAAIQTRDGRIQLISSRNHYVFNLAWLKALPVGP
ncbi:MAG: SUMF1/EgtB/PvdO family nonheme iron enzyme [Verrucomicrobiaceae bacterium]|nr:SUMF1/EgtB/PvdO family nonheme iron enzyme [Verrucomicrobiaceae bacterium]